MAQDAGQRGSGVRHRRIHTQRQNFDAMVIGFYEGKRLIYSARVRNGFTPATREKLFKVLKPYETDRCRFANLPELKSGRWGAGRCREKSGPPGESGPGARCLDRLGLFCAITPISGESYRQLTIDATRQPVPASRGMGPFPGSSLPGHSAGFPVVLDLVIGTGKLGEDGRGLIDFVITNIGDRPIRLPVSVGQNIPYTHVLTLYLTLVSGGGPVDHTTSAEIYGDNGDSQSFCLLAPGKAVRVHASTRFRLTPGRHSLTAYAELLELVGGSSKLLGTLGSSKFRSCLRYVPLLTD